MHLDLAGRAFWHLITNGGGNSNVVGIQSINPDWVTKEIYTEDRTRLLGWEIAISGSNRRVLPAEDVVMFRYPDPIDPVGGMSPIRAVAMSADMDTYSRAYAASHLRNHAQPTGILTTESDLTREQAAVLADAWKDSHQGQNNIQVLGKGASFQTLSAHIKDLEFLNLARVSRDQILAAYHMPASKLGLVEDSSRANGEEADRVYSALCLGPRLRRYHEPLTHRVLPRLGLDSTRYCFEFDPVEVGDKTFDRDAAQAAFQAGAITLDEYRDRIGFGPAADDKGSVYFVPMGASVVDSPESSLTFEPTEGDDQSTPELSAARGEAGIGESVAPELVLNGAQVTSLIQVVEAMMTGALPYASALEIIQSAFGMSLEKAQRILGPESNAGINKPAETEAAVARALSIVRDIEVKVDERPSPEPSAERIEIAALRFIRSQGEAERRMKGRVRAVFSRMQKVVLAAVKATKSAKPKTRGIGDIDFDELIDDFNVDLESIFTDESFKLYEQGHKALAAEVASAAPEVGIDFDLVSDDVLDHLRKQSAKKVVDVSKVTKKTIRGIVTAGIEDNASNDAIADTLLETFENWKAGRAETIARTETSAAFNEGKFAHAERIDEENDDVEIFKTWVPTQDDRTRDAHRAAAIRANGPITIPVDQAFRVGGETMQRPHDQNGSGSNVINCRCVLTMEMRDK